MLKLNIGYPTREEEREIMERMAVTSTNLDIDAVISPADILAARKVVDEIYLDEKIKNYIIDLVFATREPASYDSLGDLDRLIEYGASPRATIDLATAAKAHAFIRGRGYVTTQDVKSIGMEVLRHRVIITYEAEAAEMTSEDIVSKIFSEVEVP